MKDSRICHTRVFGFVFSDLEDNDMTNLLTLNTKLLEGKQA